MAGKFELVSPQHRVASPVRKNIAAHHHEPGLPAEHPQLPWESLRDHYSAAAAAGQRGIDDDDSDRITPCISLRIRERYSIFSSIEESRS